MVAVLFFYADASEEITTRFVIFLHLDRETKHKCKFFVLPVSLVQLSTVLHNLSIWEQRITPELTAHVLRCSFLDSRDYHR